MACVWAGLGVILGLGVSPASGDVVGVVACMVTGIIELAALGAILTFIGGRPGESLVGAGCGLALGAIAGLAGVPTGPVPAAPFGLVVGALAGATLRAYFRLITLPVVLLVRITTWGQRS
jgi:hypothetical protein